MRRQLSRFAQHQACVNPIHEVHQEPEPAREGSVMCVQTNGRKLFCRNDAGRLAALSKVARVRGSDRKRCAPLSSLGLRKLDLALWPIQPIWKGFVLQASCVEEILNKAQAEKFW